MKVFSLVVALLLGVATFAQDVPAKVTTAFADKFGAEEEADWEEGKTGWTASFYHNGMYKNALFSKSGKWINTQTFMGEEEAPVALVEATYDQHPRGFIDRVVKVEEAQGTYYNVTVEDSNAQTSLKLSAEGKVLGSTKLAMLNVEESDENEDDDDW